MLWLAALFTAAALAFAFTPVVFITSTYDMDYMLAMAFVLAQAWPQLKSKKKAALWALLGVALVFRILIYPFSNLAPNSNLWAYYWNLFLERKSATAPLRYAMALLFVLATAYWQAHRVGYRPWKSIPIFKNSV